MLRQAGALGFPSAEMVTAAAGLFSARTPWGGASAWDRRNVDSALPLAGRMPADPSRDGWYSPDAGVAPEGRRTVLRIASGAVQLRCFDPARAERRANPPLPAASVSGSVWETSADVANRGRVVPAWEAALPTLPAVDVAEEPAPRRSRITAWSQKSRANLVRSVSMVDWEPFFGRDGDPVMLTLTYPRDWLAVAPTGRDVKRHLGAFRRRWERRFGALLGMWKLEFQGRAPGRRSARADDDGRAPHLHLFVMRPASLSPVDFRLWCSTTWASVVGHPDPAEYLAHLAAGTAVDRAEGARMRDPRRLAVYFLGHSLKHEDGKEYQHRVPAAWEEPGAGPGRFWGLWGVGKHVADVDLTPADFLLVKRTMRRWSRSRGRVKTRTVTRLDTRTGQLRRRLVSRRAVQLGLAGFRGGFLVLNDGPAFASALSRALAAAG